VRFPQSDATIEQIWLSEDGTATHGWIADATGAQSKVPRRDTVLHSTLFQALLELRATWCESPPPLGELKSPNQFYEIGLRCDGVQNAASRTQRIVLSLKQLPLPLQQLVAVVSASSR
jgi:hypothetical protein